MNRTTVVMLLTVAALTACGGDDTADQTPSTAASPTASVAAPTTPSSGTAAQVVPLDVAPCSLLTADEVGVETGLPAVAGVEDGPISCRFDLTGTNASIFVAVEDGEGRISGPASVYDAYLAEGEEVITGVGDSAVYSSTFRAIAVDAGDGRFFTVGVNGGFPPELADPKDALIALATLALARL